MRRKDAKPSVVPAAAVQVKPPPSAAAARAPFVAGIMLGLLIAHIVYSNQFFNQENLNPDHPAQLLNEDASGDEYDDGWAPGVFLSGLFSKADSDQKNNDELLPEKGTGWRYSTPEEAWAAEMAKNAATFRSPLSFSCAIEYDHVCEKPVASMRRTRDRSEFRNLVFVKTPKCGSSTIAGVVRNLSFRRNLYCGKILPNFSDGPRLYKDVLEDFERNKRSTDVGRSWAVHGPLRFNLNKAYPNAFKMTVLREPVDRLLSAYYYWGAHAYTRWRSGDPPAVVYAKHRASPSNRARWRMWEYLRNRAKTSSEAVCQYDLSIVTDRLHDSLTLAAIVSKLSLQDIVFSSSKNSTKRFGNDSSSGSEDWYERRRHVHRPPMSQEHKSVVPKLQSLRERAYWYKNDFEMYDVAVKRLDGLISNCPEDFRALADRFKEIQGAASDFCVKQMRRPPCYFRDNGCYAECLNEWVYRIKPWWPFGGAPDPVELSAAADDDA